MKKLEALPFNQEGDMIGAQENKKNCKCCLFLGLIFVLIGIFADNIGIGTSMGIGWKQAIVIVVGLCLFILGFMPCRFDKFRKCSKDKK